MERVYRQLRASLHEHERLAWNNALPWVLLGIFNTVRNDTKYTQDKITFGTAIRLPGKFIDSAIP